MNEWWHEKRGRGTRSGTTALSSICSRGCTRTHWCAPSEKRYVKAERQHYRRFVPGDVQEHVGVPRVRKGFYHVRPVHAPHASTPHDKTLATRYPLSECA
ncbi:hypothetical protein RSAG8_13878, partial [Rhizoctonia solani AG-8 WAC10335]